MKKQKKNFARFQHWHDVFGIFVFFISALTFLALVSYQHNDPTLFNQFKNKVSNLGGTLGANLAEALIQVVGIAAFLLIPGIFSIAIFLFQRQERKKIITTLFSTALMCLSFATILSAFFTTLQFGNGAVASGGFLGEKTAHALTHSFGRLGAILLLSSVCAITALFITPFSTSTLARGLYAAASWLFRQMRDSVKTISDGLVGFVQKLIEIRRTESLMASKLQKNTAIAEADTKKESSLSRDEIAFESLNLLDDENPVEPTKKESNESSLSFFTRKITATKKNLPAKTKPAQPRHTGTFTLPTLDFLKEPEQNQRELDKNRLVENSKILESKLSDFGIDGNVVAVRPGPVITMYEFKPGPGVKISKIAALADDLSLALSAQSVRIVAPIPGKNVIGIEIPNDEREKVFLREILGTEDFQNNAAGIPLAIGKDISGLPVSADLGRMPHLLIAGAPGAGKSVFINSVICSLLYKFTPTEMRLIMVDPKQLELNLYEDIPHLLLPVVDDPKKASNALKWAVNEMERRYKIMARAGIRNIVGFNQKLEREGADKMRELLCPMLEGGMPDPQSLAHLFEFDEAGRPRMETFPFILVIIDEFADLMMVAPKDIETSVARLAQKARAAGIHLVIATQRPSVDVITGLIKANLPSRISFQVASKIDSRTILDSIGAEKLLGQGDLLFIPPGLARLTRIHGAYIDEDEIGKLCDHWRSQGKPDYREEILVDTEEEDRFLESEEKDALYDEAITIVRELGQASASMLQRRLKVGYNRAARMIENMEAQGLVGPPDGARPRQVF